MVRTIINGACGRMGQRLVTLVTQDPDMEVAGALERKGHPDVGKDVGLLAGIGEIGVTVTEDVSTDADVLVDFSAPASTILRAGQAAERKIGMVIGTTGMTDGEKAEVHDFADQIPILISPNMSLGVNVLFRIAGEVARILGQSFDIEVIEAHHNLKKDAPSGTAVRLAEIVTEALGRKYPEGATHGRHGLIGERPRGEVGVHAIRGGDIVGDHTVLFAGQGERLELVHRAQSRDTFAQGALRAAKFLAGKPPGTYSITDVLEAELG